MVAATTTQALKSAVLVPAKKGSSQGPACFWATGNTGPTNMKTLPEVPMTTAVREASRSQVRPSIPIARSWKRASGLQQEYFHAASHLWLGVTGPSSAWLCCRSLPGRIQRRHSKLQQRRLGPKLRWSGALPQDASWVK